MRRIIVNIIIFGFVLLPLILWGAWLLKPVHKTNIMIMDKTVLTQKGLEHRAFNWILVHNKYVKPNGDFYSVPSDYKGFFPLQNDSFRIKDLSVYSDKQIDSLSNVYDMANFTDTYGIYYNEWYRNKDLTEHSEKVYGGLDKFDVKLLKKMKAKKKLILAEFNFFATPTSSSEKAEIEILFGLKWSGWTGRYFSLLDTIKNPELPRWVIRLYKEQHQNKWPFTKSGIVFVHTNETIAILENNTDLENEVPMVKSFKYGVSKFNIPKKIKYPYWFDITLSSDTNNRVISYYEVSPNSRGDSILQHHNIPKIFPAAFENIKSSPYYYFCGDFTDSPIDHITPKILAIDYFTMFVLNENDLNDRTAFFWRYSLPMTTKILKDYYKK